MRLQVACYAGYRGEQTPRVLRLGERTVQVVEVLDCWLAPDYRYFKLRGDDQVTYIVRHAPDDDAWELIVCDSGNPGAVSRGSARRRGEARKPPPD